MRRDEFFRTVATNEEAIRWCRNAGLLSSGERCPTCYQDMRMIRHHSKDGAIWVCERKVAGQRHRCQTSIRSGSIFERSHMPISHILQILYEWSRATPCHEVAYQLRISRPTVMEWNQVSRRVCSHYVRQTRTLPIGGMDTVVEMDECQLGRRKHHRGRVPEEIWAIGGVVRGTHATESFIEIVKKRNRATLIPIIQRHVHPHSRIITDCWAAYNTLTTLGYHHDQINHSENFVSTVDPSIHTQSIENMWRLLRRFLATKGTRTRTHLHEYIHEFLFRRSNPDTFPSLINGFNALNENQFEPSNEYSCQSDDEIELITEA